MAEGDARRSNSRKNWTVDLLQTALVFAVAVGFFGAAAAAVGIRQRGPVPDVLGFGAAGLVALAVAGLRVWALRVTWWDRHETYPPDPVVELAQGNELHVSEGYGVDRRALRALGGRRSWLVPWSWTFKYSDNHELARLLAKLRDLDMVFSYSPGEWLPGAIFELFREQGLVEGPYRRYGDYPWTRR